MYWPEEGTECYGEFEVELVGMEKCSGFTIRNITVNDRRVRERKIIIIVTPLTL